MIELLSPNDYRDQFNGVEFPIRCSTFVPVIIEFSISRSIIWTIESHNQTFMFAMFVRLSTYDRVDNLIQIDFNSYGHANMIDCWIVYSNETTKFSFNAVDQFQQFLATEISYLGDTK